MYEHSSLASPKNDIVNALAEYYEASRISRRQQIPINTILSSSTAFRDKSILVRARVWGIKFNPTHTHDAQRRTTNDGVHERRLAPLA